MTTDTRYLIMGNIRDTFDLITKAGGYNFDAAYKGIGVKHYIEIPEDKFPALMVAGADEDRENSTNRGFTSQMDVVVIGVVRSSDAHDPQIAERDLSRLIADLTKALYVDPTRGGYSTFTEIGEILTDKGNAELPFAVFRMALTVEYRATFAAP